MVDAVDVAGQMHDLLQRTLGERIDFAVTDPGPGQWLCLSDRNQLEVALLNLVLNARAAIAVEGRVEISFANRSVTVADAPSAKEEPLLSGDYVVVMVTDTGSGMAEDVRQQAFEPFFTTKPTGEGTGLGLSQIYGFARQSGGTVRLESALGRGTKVEIILPRAASISVQATDDAARDNAVSAKAPFILQPGNGEIILLAEDEPNLRHVAIEALREAGYHPVAVANADEALAMLDSGQHADMLFTDIMMPGRCNGVDLALEIRRRQLSMPVLFATGYSDRAVLDRWQEPIDLLAKPYSVDDLAVQIGQCLARAKKPALA